LGTGWQLTARLNRQIGLHLVFGIGYRVPVGSVPQTRPEIVAKIAYRLPFRVATDTAS